MICKYGCVLFCDFVTVVVVFVIVPVDFVVGTAVTDEQTLMPLKKRS
jgi:hypothetical protein